MPDTIETRALQLASEQAEPIDPATIRFDINGKPYFAAEDLDMPLVLFLRDVLQLTGTKFACGDGADCGGICTVLLDERPVRACRTTLASIEGKSVTTIEGIGANRLGVLQKAWIDEDVIQCGYCDSAWLVLGSALLARNRQPSFTDLVRNSITCTCGSQYHAHRAIVLAGERLRGGDK